MKLVNITQHAIRVRLNLSNQAAEPDDTDLVLVPSGTVARVTAESTQVSNINGIAVVAQTFGEMENLPAPQEDTVFVASMLVAQKAALIGRTDVVGPDTSPRGGQIKDSKGFTFAVTRFQKF